MKIGVFDSGVGGLTVLKSLYEKYPNNEYIYIGDNKNIPYGDKTKKELKTYASRIIDYFINNDVKLVVIACNTICSNVFNELKEKYKDITLIGVIDSTISSFINKNKRNVLVIGTTKTIESNIYETKIKEINKDINVYSLATPELVPLIENGENVEKVLDNYLKDYNYIDSIILGCTHYKLIEENINKDIDIINSSDSIVYIIKKYIDNDIKSVINIYSTKLTYEFNEFSKKIMNTIAKEIDL